MHMFAFVKAQVLFSFWQWAVSGAMAGRVCDLCGGAWPDGCLATCLRWNSYHRRDVARILERGRIPPGLVPTSRLVDEVIYRLRMREDHLTHTIDGLMEALRRLRHELGELEDSRARIVETIDTLQSFRQTGIPPTQPGEQGQQRRQPESEPDISRRLFDS